MVEPDLAQSAQDHVDELEGEGPPAILGNQCVRHGATEGVVEKVATAHGIAPKREHVPELREQRAWALPRYINVLHIDSCLGQQRLG